MSVTHPSLCVCICVTGYNSDNKRKKYKALKSCFRRYLFHYPSCYISHCKYVSLRSSFEHGSHHDSTYSLACVKLKIVNTIGTTFKRVALGNTQRRSISVSCLSSVHCWSQGVVSFSIKTGRGNS